MSPEPDRRPQTRTGRCAASTSSNRSVDQSGENGFTASSVPLSSSRESPTELRFFQSSERTCRVSFLLIRMKLAFFYLLPSGVLVFIPLPSPLICPLSAAGSSEVFEGAFEAPADQSAETVPPPLPSWKPRGLW